RVARFGRQYSPFSDIDIGVSGATCGASAPCARRARRCQRNPLAGSTGGGRWSRGGLPHEALELIGIHVLVRLLERGGDLRILEELGGGGLAERLKRIEHGLRTLVTERSLSLG